MKNISEIIAGVQLNFPLKFDPQEIFHELLTDDHRAILTTLQVIEEYLPTTLYFHYQSTGRPYQDDLCYFRAFIAKSFLRIETTKDLIGRLKSDSNLRQICSFKKRGLSEASFSRRFEKFAKLRFPHCVHEQMVTAELANDLVFNLGRDSTAIETREKPINKKKDVKIEKKKRGRPKKGEKRPKNETRLEKQLNQSSGESLAELNYDPSWGGKRNSQGNPSYWKGYKLHLDVTDYGLPVTAVLTGANVHDSQLAIPMEKITEKRVSHLYSLMDAAYDAEPIKNFIVSRGRQSVIDPKKRRSQEKVPLAPVKKERFKARSTVERANAHLKDWFFAKKIFVKGPKKVFCQLVFGVLCLATVKIIQYHILPELEKAA